jgi:hypothetical protein
VTLEPPLAESVATPLRLPRSHEPPQLVPAQDSADTCEQFPEAERFGHVVVSAKLEADNAVDFVEPVTGCDDDRDVGAGSNLSEQVQAVVLAQSQVQDDQARLARQQVAAQLVPAGGGTDWYVMFLEVTGDHPSRRRIVIHNQNAARFAAVVTVEGRIHG